MAKRKTARQIVASRRNIKKAQIVSARKRRVSRSGILKGVAIGAFAAGAAVTARRAYNNSQYTTLYHHTEKTSVPHILKEGLKDPWGTHGGKVFVSNKANNLIPKYDLGVNAVVGVKVHKKYMRQLIPDKNHPRVMRGGEKFYAIPPEIIKTLKYSKVKSGFKSPLHGNRTSSKVSRDVFKDNREGKKRRKMIRKEIVYYEQHKHEWE
jgi:hypothetical protein